MSLLLTGVAVKTSEAEVAVQAMAAWFQSLDVTMTPASAPDRWAGVSVFAPESGWTVAIAAPTVPSDQLGLGIARSGLLTSAVSVYEDVYWTHTIADGGRVLDRFVNIPDYFGPEDDPGDAWRGDASAVAQAVGADAAAVAPYFRQFTAEEEFPLDTRAHDDDQFELLDGWVIVDFWRRLGIRYPNASEPLFSFELGPRGYATRLPASRV